MESEKKLLKSDEWKFLGMFKIIKYEGEESMLNLSH